MSDMTAISPFNWRETPRQTTNNRAPMKSNLEPRRLYPPTNHRGNITLTGAEQGAIDAAKLARTRGASR